MCLLAMNSLYSSKHEKKKKKKGNAMKQCVTRTIVFQRKNSYNSIVCFTQCTLFFQYVCFLLLICLLCISTGNHMISSAIWNK